MIKSSQLGGVAGCAEPASPHCYSAAYQTANFNLSLHLLLFDHFSLNL